MKIISEDLYRFVMETSRPYPDEEIMHFLDDNKWTFEEIAEQTGYSINYVREVNELYEYLQSKKHEQSEEYFGQEFEMEIPEEVF